ncbi:FAD/NAD(P)-binding protein [Streptomyces sp. AK02-01A]|uniref:FAD/NAD(P)-binding protein n=1 Tax=Streptomyces sp. AK02-01A TaxID=3028648 RepID=UPI0029A2F269|nr:FAD/NAD(P)-binding protein [Streptomyces sp. AK02-01A]MDX3850606.1 FAD/NAD(P)-binding protein [Streptomyces sp. AK02-01A]
MPVSSDTARNRPVTPSLVVIGAGPRGTGFLERIAANARSLYGGLPLDIHLVDPHPPGGGRIWRRDQSPLLWMNSMAQDVTMYTDDTVPLAGPVRQGPALHEWARDIREGRSRISAESERAESERAESERAESRGGESDGERPPLRTEIAELTGETFPSRRLQSAYLSWVYEQTVAALPPGVTVHRHRTHALRVSGPRDGRQRVWLEDRVEPLLADLVVLTLGHLDGEPDEEQRELSRFADRHGLIHLPPDFTADSDLSALPAGEPVIVRGFGLAFIDLMVLLTEGRGGRYSDAARENGDDGTDGKLVYHPSGREPVLYVGSRRGVPYHSKIGYGLDGERPPLPRFLGPEQIDELLNRPGPPDFRRDVWPLAEKELGYAHYHRLFTAHPERTRIAWTDFEEKYAAVEPASPELEALVAAAVPDPADRLDLDALDRPLRGVRFPSYDALQDGLRRYISDDLARRHDPSHSADLAVFLGLLSVYGQLIRLGDMGDTGGRWHGFFSYVASGPPGPRLRQLLALSEAGVVRFLGPDMTVEADERRGIFRAGGAGVPGEHIEARALVEARLPDPSPERTRSPLLRGLYEEGAAATSAGLVRVDPDDGRLLESDGRPHPRRFALGPYTTARSSGAFTRPRTGGAAFRQNDATARAALGLLRDLSCRTSPGA